MPEEPPRKGVQEADAAATSAVVTPTPSSPTDGAMDRNQALLSGEKGANGQSQALTFEEVPPSADGLVVTDTSASQGSAKTQYPSTITARFVKKQHRIQNLQGLQHALQSAVSKTAAVWETGRLFDGGILTSANTNKWYKQAMPVTWVKKISSEYNLYGNYVVVRSTGVQQWEDMPIYARIGMHIVFGNTFDQRLANSIRIQKLFSTESIKQGQHFDAPASVAQIPNFIKTYKLNLSELEEPDPTKYATFNDFFHRKLKPGARPIAEPNDPDIIVSAADCRLSVFETIESATKIWIKGRQFTLPNLLQDAELAAQYEGGSIAIFRLAPQDYHRYHSPVQGHVARAPVLLGNQYFTVNPMAVRSEINVFTENVRKLTVIDLQQRKGRGASTPSPPPSSSSSSSTPPHQSSHTTQEEQKGDEDSFNPDDYEPASAPFDQCLYVSIGALLVGSIVLTGAGKPGNELHKGDELGYFAYGGSTCILLFKKGAVAWDQDLLLHSHNGLETLVKVGERVGVRQD
ncbi:hypothetical protein DFQ27_002910 [Actinomortierella ambigua]|uniref:Phosphatidylserine decarboxylase n=1 Tax=Actinomortierella ambigua TaxID=1343610 RepID=A0A9P6U6B3_9FUNG|nr:hypothetical protein DFQ27_002910 [Actinomortierella ambigua]